jgi:hypothetical protein
MQDIAKEVVLIIKRRMGSKDMPNMKIWAINKWWMQDTEQPAHSVQIAVAVEEPEWVLQTPLLVTKPIYSTW